MTKTVVAPVAAAAIAKHAAPKKRVAVQAKQADGGEKVPEKSQFDDDEGADRVVKADHGANARQFAMLDAASLSDYSMQDASSGGETPAAEKDDKDDGAGYAYADDDGIDSGILIGAGVLALAGGVAAIASGGGKDSPPAPNRAPTFAASSQSVTTNEDAAAQVKVSATDADGDTLTYTVSTNPTKGSVTGGAGGTFTYTPAADFFGSDSFVVTANDGKGGTATVTVNVTVSPVNDAPRPDGDNTSTLVLNEDTSSVVVISFTDPEGDLPLTLTVVDGPDNGVFGLVNGENTYAPNLNFHGTDSITYTVTDSKGAVATHTVNITVNAVNDLPVAAASQGVDTTEGVAVEVAVVATDVDGDVLAYSVKEGNGPANGTVTGGTDGVFTYTPGAGFSGADSFIVIIDDGKGGTITQTVNVQVGPDIETFSLDIVGPNPTTPANVDASTDPFIFTDNAGVNTDVFITGFTGDDVIRVTGADETEYNFGTSPDDPRDLYITFSSGSATNLILIDDVLDVGAAVFDFETAIEAVGFNFITFG
jgi:VCBS repeat-containing protein